MKNLVWMLVVALALLLSACQGVSPTSLAPTSQAASLELPQGFRWEKDMLSGAKVAYGLAAGAYFPIGQDRMGTYYKGPQGCVTTKMVAMDGKATPASPMTATDGGVFVPKDGPPKFFVLLGTGQIYRNGELQAPGGKSPQSVGDTALIGAPFATNASPIAAGVGVGIGVGIAKAADEASRGNVSFPVHQPDAAALRTALGLH